VDPLVGYFSSSFASLPFIATVSSIAIAIGVILFYGNKKKRTRNIEDTRTTHKHKRS
jgi:preprotein translocase subunit SecF